MLISFVGEANSPVFNGIILNGICPIRFAVAINKNNEATIGICFLPYLQIIASTCDQKNPIRASQKACSLEGIIVNFLVAIKAKIIKKPIASHIVTNVSILHAALPVCTIQCPASLMFTLTATNYNTKNLFFNYLTFHYNNTKKLNLKVYLFF